jgi:hypothetical protein
LAETSCCIPLHDPLQVIAKLKSEVEKYPSKLKATVIQYSLWHAEFTIWHADYFYRKQDVFNVMGCLTRGVKNMVNALFAINEIYPLGDKRAIEILEQATRIPSNSREKIESILCANKATIGRNIEQLKDLFEEIKELADGKYRPFYKLRDHQESRLT